MSYTVSITSQGQISIPAPLRRKLELDQTRRALVREKEGKIIIEPVKDFLQLNGSLKTTVKVSTKQIRKGFEDYLANQVVE